MKTVPENVEKRIFELKRSGKTNVEISGAIVSEFSLTYSYEKIRKMFLGTGLEGHR